MKFGQVIALLLLCTGCACKGHVPHYILTDSPETKQALHQCQDSPVQGENLIHELPEKEVSQ